MTTTNTAADTTIDFGPLLEVRAEFDRIGADLPIVVDELHNRAG